MEFYMEIYFPDKNKNIRASCLFFPPMQAREDTLF